MCHAYVLPLPAARSPMHGSTCIGGIGASDPCITLGST